MILVISSARISMASLHSLSSPARTSGFWFPPSAFRPLPQASAGAPRAVLDRAVEGASAEADAQASEHGRVDLGVSSTPLPVAFSSASLSACFCGASSCNGRHRRRVHDSARLVPGLGDRPRSMAGRRGIRSRSTRSWTSRRTSRRVLPPTPPPRSCCVRVRAPRDGSALAGARRSRRGATLSARGPRAPPPGPRPDLPALPGRRRGGLERSAERPHARSPSCSKA